MKSYDWGPLVDWADLGTETGGVVTLEIHPPDPGKSYRRIVFKPGRVVLEGGWEFIPAVSLSRDLKSGSLKEDVEQAVCEIRRMQKENAV